MADNFSQEQVQSIFGDFKPVIDTSVTPSQENVQSVFGEFIPVLDEAAGVAAAVPASFDIFPQTNVTLYSRAFIPFIPGLQFMSWRNFVPVPAGAGRIMSSLVAGGGLAGKGGIAGKSGGLAG